MQKTHNTTARAPPPADAPRRYIFLDSFRCVLPPDGTFAPNKIFLPDDVAAAARYREKMKSDSSTENPVQLGLELENAAREGYSYSRHFLHADVSADTFLYSSRATAAVNSKRIHSLNFAPNAIAQMAFARHNVAQQLRDDGHALAQQQQQQQQQPDERTASSNAGHCDVQDVGALARFDTRIHTATEAPTEIIPFTAECVDLRSTEETASHGVVVGRYAILSSRVCACEVVPIVTQHALKDTKSTEKLTVHEGIESLAAPNTKQTQMAKPSMATIRWVSQSKFAMKKRGRLHPEVCVTGFKPDRAASAAEKLELVAPCTSHFPVVSANNRSVKKRRQADEQHRDEQNNDSRQDDDNRNKKRKKKHLTPNPVVPSTVSWPKFQKPERWGQFRSAIAALQVVSADTGAQLKWSNEARGLLFKVLSRQSNEPLLQELLTPLPDQHQQRSNNNQIKDTANSRFVTNMNGFSEGLQAALLAAATEERIRK